MKVKFKIGVAGIDFAHVPGDVAEIKDKLAKVWIADGTVEPVKSSPKVERATKKHDAETPEDSK